MDNKCICTYLSNIKHSDINGEACLMLLFVFFNII